MRAINAARPGGVVALTKKMQRVISSPATSSILLVAAEGNNLEQSLIASGVNGRKWVGCGGKPHIPANCSNAQEANCQFDGTLSLSN